MVKRKNFSKSGQLTLFIIIGIVIVAAGVLVYFFLPNLRPGLVFEEQTPEKYIQTCLESDIEDAINTLALQGGSIKPEHYILNEGNRIEYLCYQEEDYKTCVVQQPLLKRHVENEIKKEVLSQVKSCFDRMEQEYKDKGYEINLRKGEYQVELLPKRVVLSFNNSLTLSKGESVQRMEKFRVILNNNLYELVSIANSIIEWEATYGDAETTIYMTYYKDLKVEKIKKVDGSTIYMLTDRNTNFKFQFASRSVVWPAGYGS
ncbi:MAG TPA: hypothetical protein VJH92_00320 [Candidatus Nanoarchaeia archaeon]|nr:hypothetical protein [Candidatus Nanoarchaeia archaeon]